MTLTLKALSALLTYPDEALARGTAEIETALRDEALLDASAIEGLRPLLAELGGRDLFDLQERFVLLFDRSRSLSLNLFEHVHGESRARGQAMVDLLETYRDMSVSLLDIYLSSVSNRLNEIMRVLTMIATVFIPLTFIVGVYGMNFDANNTSPWAMPELYWYYGYPLVWLLMIAIAVGMLVFFRRRRWL